MVVNILVMVLRYNIFNLLIIKILVIALPQVNLLDVPFD